MKRTTRNIILALILSFSVCAHKCNPQENQTLRSSGNTSPTTLENGPLFLIDNSSSMPTSESRQQEKTPPQQKPKPTPPSKPSGPEIPRPPIQDSMVGYITNAVVGSQIRIRSDAGFGNNRPDRSEFFYAQCGCNSATAPGPGSPPGNPPPPPPQGLVSNLNFQVLSTYGEFAPIRRFSLFAEVPLRWFQVYHFATPPPNFRDSSGPSDVQAGFKLAMLASDSRYLTFQFQAYFPTGHAFNALGTNHYSVEPALLYFQRLNNRLSLEAEFGDWHPIDGSLSPNSQEFAGDVLFYGIGPSYKAYRSERVTFAPVIEVVGWRVLGGLETNASKLPNNPIVSATDTNIVNVKVGARTTIGANHSFYIGFGQAVTQERWYRHFVRFEYRFAF